MKGRFGLLVFLTFLIATAATAAPIELSDSSRGSYDNFYYGFATGGSGAPGGNFLTGLYYGTENRSFFVFDLSGVVGPITSANLTLGLSASTGCGGPCHFLSPDASETFGLFDYSGSIAALTAGTGGVSAFNDLGTGTSFGSLVVTPSDAGTVTLVFNAAGVSALNAAVGGKIAFGGAITSIAGSDNQALFGSSWTAFDPLAISNLTLNPETSPVPEPASLLLLAPGVLGFVLKRKSNS